MKIQYFNGTDTLYIEFNTEAVETVAYSENMTLELDDNGEVCAVTVEHAGTRTDCKRIELVGLPFQGAKSPD